MNTYAYVERGHIHYGVIATGNQLILIRCAEHHPTETFRVDSSINCCEIKRLATN